MDGIVVPTRPEWCFEGDDPGDRDDNVGGETSKGKEPMGRKKACKKGIQNEVCIRVMYCSYSQIPNTSNTHYLLCLQQTLYIWYEVTVM